MGYGSVITLLFTAVRLYTQIRVRFKVLFTLAVEYSADRIVHSYVLSCERVDTETSVGLLPLPCISLLVFTVQNNIRQSKSNTDRYCPQQQKSEWLQSKSILAKMALLSLFHDNVKLNNYIFSIRIIIIRFYRLRSGSIVSVYRCYYGTVNNCIIVFSWHQIKILLV